MAEDWMGTRSSVIWIIILASTNNITSSLYITRLYFQRIEASEEVGDEYNTSLS